MCWAAAELEIKNDTFFRLNFKEAVVLTAHGRDDVVKKCSH